MSSVGAPPGEGNGITLWRVDTLHSGQAAYMLPPRAFTMSIVEGRESTVEQGRGRSTMPTMAASGGEIGAEAPERKAAVEKQRRCRAEWNGLLAWRQECGTEKRREGANKSGWLPKRAGGARRALREQHEGEHCAMAKFVGRQPFISAVQKVSVR
jgi:hypothetical protein